LNLGEKKRKFLGQFTVTKTMMMMLKIIIFLLFSPDELDKFAASPNVTCGIYGLWDQHIFFEEAYIKAYPTNS
jgi:hypothetical protein